MDERTKAFQEWWPTQFPDGVPSYANRYLIPAWNAAWDYRNQQSAHICALAKDINGVCMVCDNPTQNTVDRPLTEAQKRIPSLVEADKLRIQNRDE